MGGDLVGFWIIVQWVDTVGKVAMKMKMKMAYMKKGADAEQHNHIKAIQ
jgi:hypothetical protein